MNRFMDSDMLNSRILWIDLCSQPERSRFADTVSREHAVTTLRNAECLTDTVHNFRPQLVCIEFDYPDDARLQTVPAIKRDFPSLPLLMLTEYHSEALAVWAFRSGVGDYRVKPVETATLMKTIGLLADHQGSCCQCGRCGIAMAPDLVEPSGHLRGPLKTVKKTGQAVAYIAQHYAEQIRAQNMSALCHLSSSEFSRVFHREQGVTFAHFLVESRIGKARELLMESDMTITEVACSVGFNDPSYFSRAFRRSVGIKASDYQRQVCAPPQTLYDRLIDR